MPYCTGCEAQRPEGTFYCVECGSRLQGTDNPPDEQVEVGRKMGESAPDVASAPAGVVRPRRRLADVWGTIGSGGKTALLGAIVAFVGYFVPSSQNISPGLVVTRSLAGVGNLFMIIPVLSVLVAFLIYWQTQERPLRNRLFIQTSMIGIGALMIPLALSVWAGGLVGGLLVFIGFALVIAGGYTLMADSTHSLV